MGVKIEGRMPVMERVSTGLHSLDRMFAYNNEIGLPIRTGLELYGRWETGKSTLAYYLAGRVRPSGVITLLDLEGGARQEYVASAVEQAGFDGVVRYVEWEDSKGKRRSHEDMLKIGADTLLEDDVGVLILDSAAIVAPIPEIEGDLSDANMGRRAQLLARWSRRWVPWLNIAKDPKLVIIVNHMLADMGGYGMTTPGGDTMKFGCVARMRLKRAETFDDGAFEVDISLDKLRYGGKSKSRRSRVVIVPGIGVSPHLTTAFDCMELGYARRKTSVQILSDKDNEDSWVNVAKLSTLFDHVRDGKLDTFDPFYERLAWDNSTSLPPD